jgi:hypothetical protein
MLRAPTNGTQRQPTRPTGGPVTPHVSHKEEGMNFGVHNSPAARSPAKPEVPREPLHGCELSGARGVASGARGTGNHHSWRNGGAVDRRPASSGQGTGQEMVLEHR